MDKTEQHYEERRACLLAVQGALTAEERGQFMDTAARRWPVFEREGATPASVLDYTLTYGEFPAETAAFWEAQLHPRYEGGGRVPGGLGLIVPAVLHALVLLGRPLTVTALMDLVRRAGGADPEPEEPGYDPYPDLATALVAGRHLAADPQDAFAAEFFLAALSDLGEHVTLDGGAEQAEASLRKLLMGA
jgi:hypothetical protein